MLSTEFISHFKRLISAITQRLPGSLTWSCSLALALTALKTSAAETQRPRGHYLLPSEGNVIGQPYTVVVTEEQTLLDIAREHNVGYQEIRDANQEISIWLLGKGTEVVIPARHILPSVPRGGIVINLAELRLYYYSRVSDGETPWMETYPIGIGREGYDNPLGRHAILLGIPGYLLHGTNRPDGIGMRVSRGCIRLYPEDIESLFARVPSRTFVHLVDTPFKVGWSGDSLYVQSFRPLADQEADLADMIAVLETLQQARKDNALDIDYARLREAMEAANGRVIPLVPRDRGITPASQPRKPPNNFLSEIAV